MTRNKFVFTLLLALAAAAAAVPTRPARAQAAWEQKPYTQWTMAEVEAILGDSPWAQTDTRSSGAGGSTALSGPVGGGYVNVRLRSALPVRQALVRLRQLKAKYDQMSPSDRAAFDAKAKPLLDCPACADNYVVTIGPPARRDNGMPTTFKGMALASIKLYVHLMDESGRERELVHFEPPKSQGDEAVFFFSRADAQGRPLVTPATKKVVVAFDPQVMTSAQGSTRRFEFDAAKLKFNGAVSF